MAHYKRGKCRYLGKTNKPSETSKRKHFGLRPIKINWRDYSWRGNDVPDWGIYGGPSSWSVPRWHDILHHTRRRRAAEKRCAVRLMQGKDPEDLAWPLSRKPTIYYW